VVCRPYDDGKTQGCLGVLISKMTYSSGPHTFWMLGRIRDLVSVRGPDSFVLKKRQNNNTRTITHVCYLFYFFRNKFAMWLIKLILLLHNSCSIWFLACCWNMESVVHTCIQNSVSTLGFTIYLRNELFAKINTSTNPNQF